MEKEEGRRKDSRKGRTTKTTNDEMVCRNKVMPSSAAEGVRTELVEHATL